MRLEPVVEGRVELVVLGVEVRLGDPAPLGEVVRGHAPSRIVERLLADDLELVRRARHGELVVCERRGAQLVSEESSPTERQDQKGRGSSTHRPGCRRG